MKNQNIWIVFSVIFIILAIYHFYLSDRKTKKFQYHGIKAISGVKAGIVEFVDELNKYIDDNNRLNRTINIITGIGYLAAMLTSIYSFVLSI